MKKLNKVIYFLKEFWSNCKEFYTIYSLCTSTIIVSIFIFLFLEYLYILIILEGLFLLSPFGYFYLKVYEIKINVEQFYYQEKLGRYKTRAQIVNNIGKEIIIKNSKKYVLFFQIKAGKKIKNYELYWNKIEYVEINPFDVPATLEYEDYHLICHSNDCFSYILALEYLYTNDEPMDIEFYIYSKINKKIKKIYTINIKLR